MELEIERSTADQAERLTEIAFAAKRHWGYPERYIRQWRPDLTVSPEMIDTHETYAATIGDELVGFYVLITKGRQMELEHFWVVPERIGQNIGRRLFMDAVERARAHNAEAIEILSDPNAQGFYEKMGARTVGRVPAPTDDPERCLPRLLYEIGDRT